MAGLKVDEFSRAKMDATAEELAEEKTLAYSCLNWLWTLCCNWIDPETALPWRIILTLNKSIENKIKINRESLSVVIVVNLTISITLHCGVWLANEVTNDRQKQISFECSFECCDSCHHFDFWTLSVRCFLMKYEWEGNCKITRGNSVDIWLTALLFTPKLTPNLRPECKTHRFD